MQTLGQNYMCTHNISEKIKYCLFFKMYPLSEPWKLLAWRQLSMNKLFSVTSKHADCGPQDQGFGDMQIVWLQLFTVAGFPFQCRVL